MLGALMGETNHSSPLTESEYLPVAETSTESTGVLAAFPVPCRKASAHLTKQASATSAAGGRQERVIRLENTIVPQAQLCILEPSWYNAVRLGSKPVLDKWAVGEAKLH
jgi:hypothetical protein